MKSLTLGDMLHDARIGLAVESFVKAVAETFARLGNLFLYLVVIFGNLVFDEHIGAITLLRIAVIDQRVVERIDMTRSLPDGRMHEYSRVDAHDILMQQRHGLPPVTFDIVFHLHAVLTVVIDRAETVIDFA